MADESPRIRQIALAALASTCGFRGDAKPALVEKYLQDNLQKIETNGDSFELLLKNALLRPAAGDASLVWLGDRLGLTPVEIVTAALAAAVEDDPLIGRVIAHVQAPMGGSRPTFGLLERTLSAVWNNGRSVLPLLLDGRAATSGLLISANETMPLPERTIAVPAPLCLALFGNDSCWPGVVIGLDESETVPLPLSRMAEIKRHATALKSIVVQTLVIRTGEHAEARQVACEIARALNRRAAFIETEKTAGMGPWLLLRKLLPVFCLDLAPGERRYLPLTQGYQGPFMAICGADGAVDTKNNAVTNWMLTVPSQAERTDLWETVLGKSPSTVKWAVEHRHGAGRIAHLGRLARYEAVLNGHDKPEHVDVANAAWSGAGVGLESLAEPMRGRISDEAFVISPELRMHMEALLNRCRLRDDLAAGLGASATTRYRAGVKALFTGESGTGKTLAAGWIATQLASPLYRVDLSLVTSKYIGETEKNLSHLLARAEQAEVILLFDEADSLFGKRTDVNDANDRFANAQTNYLLQRIENYDGVILLTSNNQSRFDAAFARRLDFVIEFPMPGPSERRALWLSHLGKGTRLDPRELNQLAALVAVSGGHIRNAVLAAAVYARAASREITLADIVDGLAVELRKLGRQMPLELHRLGTSAGQNSSTQ